MKKKRTCLPFVFFKIWRFSLWHSYGDTLYISFRHSVSQHQPWSWLSKLHKVSVFGLGKLILQFADIRTTRKHSALTSRSITERITGLSPYFYLLPICIHCYVLFTLMDNNMFVKKGSMGCSSKYYCKKKLYYSMVTVQYNFLKSAFFCKLGTLNFKTR